VNAISARRHLAPEQPDPDPARVLRDRGAVERAEWDDPADTNERSAKPWQVSGWRRSDPVAAMFTRKSPEFEAAERLRRDVALADGARRHEQLGTRISGTAPMTPTDVQIDAIARVRAACRCWTPSELDIASWCVVQQATVSSYAVRIRMRKETALARLRYALRALASHYANALDARELEDY